MSRSEYMQQLRHELLDDLAGVVTQILTEYKVEQDKAQQCGAAVADRVAEHWGGINVQMPKDYHYKLSQRDLQIWHEFTGNNHADLARKYDLTVNAIYRIIRRITPVAISERQPDIFDNKSA